MLIPHENKKMVLEMRHEELCAAAIKRGIIPNEEHIRKMVMDDYNEVVEKDGYKFISNPQNPDEWCIEVIDGGKFSRLDVSDNFRFTFFEVKINASR
jgi:hypothetical protein